MMSQTVRSPDERFWEKVEKTETCWNWTAAKSWGYGTFWDGGFLPSGWQRLVKAHRYAYESLVGPIPAGLEIDHLCRNRACVNPAHLEPVTRRENLMRGNTLPARQAARTHCPQGHVYDERNTLVRLGKRQCRTCQRDYARARRAAKRASFGTNTVG